MDAVERQGSGALAQILLSAVIFGAAHAIWGIFGGKYRAAVAVMGHLVGDRYLGQTNSACGAAGGWSRAAT